MTKKPDTYEMLDTSTGRASRGKLIIFIVLAVLIVGALSFYLMKSKEPRKVTPDSSLVASSKAEKLAARDREASSTTHSPPVKPTQERAISSEQKVSEGTLGSVSSSAAGVEPEKPAIPRASEASPATYAGSSPKPVKEILYFGFDKTELVPNEISRLRKFCSSIGNRPGELIIEGHSDALGAEDYNYNLSIERAEHVASLLRRMGIDNRHKVQIKGLGENKPADTNATQEGRSLNRRVEVLFIAEK